MIAKKIILRICALALTLWADSSFACATCFGAEGDPQTKGLNMAIITLLGVTYSLFSGMALMAFFYWRKNSALTGNEVDGANVSSLEESSITHV